MKVKGRRQTTVDRGRQTENPASSCDYAATGRKGQEMKNKVQSCKGALRHGGLMVQSYKEEVDPRLRGDDNRTCENCRFSKAVWGLKEARLICENKAEAGKKCVVVKEDEACSNFEYSRDVVSPENARALAEGAKLIPLTQDKFAIVDAEDYEWLARYKWHAVRDKRNYYARNRRKRGVVSMHRVILNAPRGLVVDHINHNSLDNRKKNLRLCTVAENCRNRRPSKRKNKLSRYKGVSFDKKRKIFRAIIWCNKKQYFLGNFKKERDAAKAYDRKARELFGSFAYLNFPAEGR